MGESFGDRIREHKAGIIQVIVGVALAVAVSALMIMLLAATKGEISTEHDWTQGEFDKATTHINSLGSGLNDQIDNLEEEVNGYNTTLDILGTKAAGNSHDITVLQDWAEGAETRITTVEAENSPPEGYLTGTVGNYTLHAKCNEAGNFTANVHLVFTPPVAVGNTTQEDALATFYGSINWTGVVPNYICTTTYSGNTTTWSISKVSWNIGVFSMTANNETAVSILFGGLNSTYAPNFTYVEVWPVLK